ncbi:MAG: hypothetical protein A2Z21_08405 [Candidatus Fraserbacteria bacterium RBG_16_55_9]|uniref:Uncharacterized protein n=1 Tax=Fraserbacteria sp. (strain RBG_16_55_9) TaxID=1817864 RepID=A0A1F5USK9_FRAXR|nr:MAG: hypothetical protein A2Z21_08405 [Candidatus Fraserbacteria bacterium RBG_16_55_9]
MSRISVVAVVVVMLLSGCDLFRTDSLAPLNLYPQLEYGPKYNGRVAEPHASFQHLIWDRTDCSLSNRGGTPFECIGEKPYLLRLKGQMINDGTNDISRVSGTYEMWNDLGQLQATEQWYLKTTESDRTGKIRDSWNAGETELFQLTIEPSCVEFYGPCRKWNYDPNYVSKVVVSITEIEFLEP